MTVGIVLSGGGSKGDFEVGALRYLYDHGVVPEVLTGSSVGAINAIKLAEGEDPADPSRGLLGLEAIWESLKVNSDMFGESDWLTGLAPEIRSAIEGQVPLSSLGPASIPVAYFPDISTIRQLFVNLAYVTDGTGKDILTALQSALTQAQSLFTLEPIRQKLQGSLSGPLISQWAAAGHKLRLGMVGLNSGKLRYATETGALVERDGITPVTGPQPNACSSEKADVTSLEQQIGELSSQLPGAGSAKASIIRQIWQLKGQLATAQSALSTCQASVPTVPIVADLATAVLASAAFPGFFPSVAIGSETYVDGGVRAQLPVRAAIEAGATQIFAICASPMEPGSSSPPWLMLDIAWRAVGLLEAEAVAANAAETANGVTVTVIDPQIDLHSFDVIDPGLIQISRDYGYMRAADIVTGMDPNNPAWEGARQIAEQRITIWSLENTRYGQADPTHPANPTPQANPALQSSVDAEKLVLGQLIAMRESAGGANPEGLKHWATAPELHPWADVLDNASFESQNIPASIAPGQQAQVSVVMRNTGATTWKAATGYKLGSQSPQDNTTWGAGRQPLVSDVEPDATATFAFTIPAPPGPSAEFQWQMVHEGADWFGERTELVVIPQTGPSQCALLDQQIEGAMSDIADLQTQLKGAAGSQKAAIIAQIAQSNRDIAAWKKQKQTLGCP